MRTHVLIVTAICSVVMFLTVIVGGCAATQEAPVAADPFADAIRSGSLENATTRADEANRVLIVVGTADWCGPCQRMKADTWADTTVNDWVDQNALLYYLDIDQNRELSQALEIRSIPQIVAFRDGEELSRVTGYRGPEAFLEWLSSLDAQAAR